VKILHVCDSLNPAGLGGYESYLHYLSKELSSRGHESTVVTQMASREAPRRIARRNYDVIQLSGNLLEARKWEFFRQPDVDRDELARRMFTRDDLEKNVEELTEQLRMVINENEPDVIHAHSTYVVYNRVLDRIKQHSPRSTAPLLLTIHGRPKPLILPDRTQTTDYQQLAACCPFERVLAVSQNVADALGTHLPRGIPVQVLYLGIDLSIFKPLENQKRWDLAFMGRLERMKAVDQLPLMLRELSSSCPDVKLLITGDGSEREWLLREFSRCGVSDRMEYLGVVLPERVPDLINSSRVFLYPSREEPFGLSIVEAMACGVPVLTTNVFGPTEIVTHLTDGYLVEPDDASKLAEAAEVLLSDQALRSRLGSAGRETAEKRFDMRRHASELLRIYGDLPRPP
jgi:glycosyltransferase involved in cell wall biosynthesis